MLVLLAEVFAERKPLLHAVQGFRMKNGQHDMEAFRHDGWKGNVIPQQIHAVDIRKTVTSVPSSIRMLGVGRWQVDFLILHARLDKIQAGIVHGKG